ALAAIRCRQQGEEDWRTRRRFLGSSSSSSTVTSHVTEGSGGDPLSLPPIQVCLLDIRCLSWWLDNNLGVAEEEEQAP
ncbi:unnamed protein product, partial [Ectocarpus fasciculatus]